MNIIKLNCGGKLFEVSHSTINKYPNSMLAVMINSPMYNNNNNFIDRDPELFKIILDYYRTDKIIIPDNISSERVMDEIDYFCLPKIKPKNMDINQWWIENNIDIQNGIKQLDNIIKNLSDDLFINNTEICLNIQNYSHISKIDTNFIKKYLKKTYNLTSRSNYYNDAIFLCVNLN